MESRREAEDAARAKGHSPGPWVWCGCEQDCRRYESACQDCGHSITERRGHSYGGDALYYACDGTEGKEKRRREFMDFVARQRQGDRQ